MARVTGFVVFVVLLFLVESERSSGSPTRRLQANDFEEDKEGLNEKERENIRQILMLAAKELQDNDVIQVLKKSLILRLKICFSSPLPTPPSQIEALLAEGFGDKRDEGLTPEPKDRLRSVLKEALERIDEEEILDFLKASLYFRLKFCLHAPFVRHTKQDIVSKPPYSTTEKTRPSTGSSSSTAPPTTPTTGANTTETEKSTELNDMPDLPEEDLENALESISRRNEIPAPHFDDAPQDELARDDPQVPINGHDPVEQPAELERLENHRDPEKASLAESISDNDDFTKLSESLLSSKESTAIEETNEENDGLIDTASDRVGKAPVREETESAEIMTANSDVGEFDSVITIDYNALEDEEKMETGTGGVDLGPVFEPNEQLSL